MDGTDMSDCWAITINAIDELEGARTPQAVWTAISTVAGALGFEHAVVLRAREGEARFTTIHGTLQTDVAEALARAGIASNAALAKHILAARFPLVVDELPQVLLTTSQREALESAKEKLGIGAGLVVPVQTDGVAVGALLLAGRAPVLTPVLRSAVHFLA